MASSAAAGNGAIAAENRNGAPPLGEGHYDRHSMLGSLMDDSEEDDPLLYFHSIPEAFVSACPALTRINFIPPLSAPRDSLVAAVSLGPDVQTAYSVDPLATVYSSLF